MVRTKSLLWILLIIAYSHANAQVPAETRRAGTVRTSLTFSAGHFLSIKGKGAYLHGFVEYFPENNISIRGDAFLQLNQTGELNPLLRHQTFLFGAAMHFGKWRQADFFVALQPGLSQTQAIDPANSPAQWNPLISVTPGLTFYLNHFFNIFGEARLLSGRFFPEGSTSNYSLSEIRFSIGLGFHFDFKH